LDAPKHEPWGHPLSVKGPLERVFLGDPQNHYARDL
jgi:hypothetical protein